MHIYVYMYMCMYMLGGTCTSWYKLHTLTIQPEVTGLIPPIESLSLHHSSILADVHLLVADVVRGSGGRVGRTKVSREVDIVKRVTCGGPDHVKDWQCRQISKLDNISILSLFFFPC